MNAQPECLSPDTIKQYLQGNLSGREREVIEDHLEICPPCLESLSAQASTITFYEAAEAASSYTEDLRAAETQIAGLKVKLKALTTKRIRPVGIPYDLTLLGDLLSPPLAPDEIGRLGGYRILEVLGHGGMGIVFYAEDTELKRPVAVKAMLPDFARDQAARSRFRREAESAAAVKHDHIVVIHQVGEDRGHLFIVMEFLEGQPLEKRLEQGPPLTLAEAVRIGWEMACGLAAAHKRGLIHRDIKPSNIFLEASDAGTRVKIVDFGLARQQEIPTDAGARLTRKGAVMGTPAYMSPEQAGGDDVDFRTDLYGAGVVLYRLTTGKLPFVAGSPSGYIKAHLTETPRNVRDENPAIPPPLASAVMQLLQKDPRQRPESAQALADVLENLVSGQPMRPQASDTPSTDPKPRRRRSLMIAVAASVLIVALALQTLFRSATPPLDQQLIATIHRTIDDEERVLAPDSPKKLAGLLPLHVGEKLELGFQVPAGYHAAFFLLDTLGKLRELAPLQVNRNGAFDDIHFPPAKIWQVDGPAGTVLFLACADRRSKPRLDDVRGLVLESDTEPLPAPKADVLFLVNREKLLRFTAEKARDLVETPFSQLQDYLKRLQSRASAAKFDYVWAAALPVR